MPKCPPLLQNCAKETEDNMDPSFQKKDREFQGEFLPEEKVPPVKDIQVDSIGRTQKHNEPASARNVSNEEEHDDKSFKYKSIPPPYTKSEYNQPKSSFREARSEEPADCDDAEAHHKSKAKQMLKSVRRRSLKAPPGEESGGGSEGNQKEKLSNKEKAAQGQRILKFFDKGGSDQPDEEERTMDKLLHYYSRKKGSQGKGKLESHATTDSSEAIKQRSRDGPNRASSLPVEVTSPPETPKRHIRAASFQPGLDNANVHVHPRLPDYDDFVARLAALKGN